MESSQCDPGQPHIHQWLVGLSLLSLAVLGKSSEFAVHERAVYIAELE